MKVKKTFIIISDETCYCWIETKIENCKNFIMFVRSIPAWTHFLKTFCNGKKLRRGYHCPTL